MHESSWWGQLYIVSKWWLFFFGLQPTARLKLQFQSGTPLFKNLDLPLQAAIKTHGMELSTGYLPKSAVLASATVLCRWSIWPIASYRLTHNTDFVCACCQSPHGRPDNTPWTHGGVDVMAASIPVPDHGGNQAGTRCSQLSKSRKPAMKLTSSVQSQWGQTKKWLTSTLLLALIIWTN